MKSPAKTSAQLRKLVEERGTIGAAEAIGVALMTLAKALDGLELKPATIALIEARLATMGEERKP